METEIVLLDTSILIDFYRKKDKSKSVFFKLLSENPDRIFAISVITHFEIYVGARPDQVLFWDNVFHDFLILPFSATISSLAIGIDSDLKKARHRIEIPDLFIAATALANGLLFATLNKKHFDRIKKLRRID